MSVSTLAALEERDAFIARHIGTTAEDQATMLGALGYPTRDALMTAIVPAAIRRAAPLALPGPMPETEALERLRAIAAKNRVMKSFIGQGYYGTHTPGCHRPQHPREPGVVHGVHAVSAGDLARQARSADHFPDDGLRPHRHGDRERVDAR
jgi:hypothetical protein